MKPRKFDLTRLPQSRKAALAKGTAFYAGQRCPKNPEHGVVRKLNGTCVDCELARAAVTQRTLTEARAAQKAENALRRTALEMSGPRMERKTAERAEAALSKLARDAKRETAIFRDLHSGWIPNHVPLAGYGLVRPRLALV